MGIIEPQANPLQLNTFEFLWDPIKNASIFIQVGSFNKDLNLKDILLKIFTSAFKAGFIHIFHILILGKLY